MHSADRAPSVFQTFIQRSVTPYFFQTYISTKKAKSAPFASKYTSQPSQANDWTPWPFTLRVACSLRRADMMLSVVFLSFVAVADRIGLTCLWRPQSKTTPDSETQPSNTTHSARVRTSRITRLRILTLHLLPDSYFAMTRALFIGRCWRVFLRPTVDGKRPCE